MALTIGYTVWRWDYKEHGKRNHKKVKFWVFKIADNRQLAEQKLAWYRAREPYRRFYLDVCYIRPKYRNLRKPMA